MEKKITSIGGQAIIEGVMMRGPHKIAMAVRKPDGEITIEEKQVKGMDKWKKIPIVRGVISFVSSMIIGVQALMFSSKFVDEETTTQEITKKQEEKTEEKEKKKEKTEGGLSNGALYFCVFLSVIFSICLFMLLPNLLADWIVPKNMITTYNIVENIVKVVIFLGYMALVSQNKDIKRVFEYHGAEHKSIFCYENGEELTIENVRKYQRFHPRCGTSFLLFVIIISIMVFSFLPRFSNAFANMGARLLLVKL